MLARLAPAPRPQPRGPQRFFRAGYQDPDRLPDDIARTWLEPIVSSRERTRQYLRLFTSIRACDLLAVEPALARLTVPTLVVWGTGDRFFHRRWAQWLMDTIPGATKLVELQGARLFFPDEHAGELTAALHHHWHAHL